jgi:hypothetical protein
MKVVSDMFLLYSLWIFPLIIVFHVSFGCAVVPAHLPVPGTGLSILELIHMYFEQGLRYQEIVCMVLVRHGISRQLKRILKNNLRRRRLVYTPINEVIEVVNSELQTSGRSLGYKAMWRRLITDHRLLVKQKTVLQVLRILDWC